MHGSVDMIWACEPVRLADLEHGDKAMSSIKHVRQQIASMASGECRYIGREDVHVYCRNPLVRVAGVDGRQRWERQPGAARYSVACPAAGLQYGTWVPACEATDTVSRILQDFAVTVSAA
jgi:hypothetical protein